LAVNLPSGMVGAYVAIDPTQLQHFVHLLIVRPLCSFPRVGRVFEIDVHQVHPLSSDVEPVGGGGFAGVESESKQESGANRRAAGR